MALTREKKPLSIESALHIPNFTHKVTHVAPYIQTFGTVTAHGKVLHSPLIGVTNSLKHILKLHLSEGRFISPLDGYSYLVVIGKQIAQQLRPPNSMIKLVGQEIQINHNIFTIVGVLADTPSNSFFNQNLNSAILMPIHTATTLNKYSQIASMVMQLKSNSPIEQVEGQLRQYIEKHTAGYQLFFRSAKQLIDSMKKQSQIYTLLLALIGSISLLVGGIGVMNIMLVSVAERKREIGIRLAIGATRRDIQLLFLIEAIALSLVGGFCGVLIGVIASYIIAETAHWPFAIYWIPMVIGFSVSVLTGLFFGYYPAHRAAKLDPIQCLRAD